MEAIDDESSDEDTKPVIQSQFQAFQHPRRSASNAMGSRQWYSGVYAEKRRQEEELAEEEKLAEEAARAGVESVSEGESEEEEESFSDAFEKAFNRVFDKNASESESESYSESESEKDDAKASQEPSQESQTSPEASQASVDPDLVSLLAVADQLLGSLSTSVVLAAAGWCATRPTRWCSCSTATTSPATSY